LILLHLLGFQITALCSYGPHTLQPVDFYRWAVAPTFVSLSHALFLRANHVFDIRNVLTFSILKNIPGLRSLNFFVTWKGGLKFFQFFNMIPLHLRQTDILVSHMRALSRFSIITQNNLGSVDWALMRKAIMFTDNYVNTRARLVSFFWADTDTDVFQFSLPISDADIFALLKQYLFCLMRQNSHSWSYFAFRQTFSNYSWKTLQCIFFFRPHKQTKSFHKLQLFYEARWRYTLLLCLVRQNIHSWSYFTTSRTWLAELVTWHVWTVTASVDCDICKWVSLIDK